MVSTSLMVDTSSHPRAQLHRCVERSAYLHSGLQPPCLRFAAAVTGRHARLGSRLLARLCRGRHRRRQTSTRLQGATRTDPGVRC